MNNTDVLKVGTAIPLHIQFKSKLKDGYYSYDETPELTLIRLKPNSAIFLDNISFSASCKTWDFSAAAVNGVGVQFSTQSGKEPVLLREIKYYAFSDFMSLNSIVQSKKPVSLNSNANKQDDYLTLSINGKIKQTEALIKDNKTRVDILISIAAYEITDADLINKLTRNYSEVVGEPPKLFNPAIPVAVAKPLTLTESRDIMPPSHFQSVRVLKSGGVGIEAWE